MSAVSVAVSTACDSSSAFDSGACGGEWPFSSCADGGGEVGRAFVGVVVALAAGATLFAGALAPWLPAAAMVSRARGLSLPGQEISPERRPVSFAGVGDALAGAADPAAAGCSDRITCPGFTA